MNKNKINKSIIAILAISTSLATIYADNSITPITIKNKNFMVGQNRFMVRGIDYQPQDDVDPISDKNLYTIQNLLTKRWQTLHINAIRVYQVDPSQPHDKVMDYLAKNGIYVMIGTVNHDTSIPRDSGDYNYKTLQRVQSVIKAFAQYKNVLGFSVANEVTNPQPGNQQEVIRDAAAIKGLVRDAKAYVQTLHKQNSKNRIIPIGVVSRDVFDKTDPKGNKSITLGVNSVQKYLAVQSPKEQGKSDIADFLGINVYRWTSGGSGNDNFSNKQAYDKLANTYENFPIPVTLTEYGASYTPDVRPFTQIPYLFTDKTMHNSISGGFVYRFFNRSTDKDGLGLVYNAHGYNSTLHGGYKNLVYRYSRAEKTNVPLAVNPSKKLTVPSALANVAPVVPYVPSTDQKITVNFNSGDLQPTGITHLSLSYGKPQSWTSIVSSFPLNGTATIPKPDGNEQVSIAYQKGGQYYGTCVVKATALQACATKTCTISAAWQYRNPSTPCAVTTN